MSKSTLAPIEAAQLAQHQAERVRALWETPILPERQAAEALNLPLSTFYALKKYGGGPQSFRLGRRLYVRTDELRAWVENLAKQEPKP